MAEGNGEVSMEEKANIKEETSKVERTEDYAKLVNYGLDEKVAGKLDEIYKTGRYFPIRLSTFVFQFSELYILTYFIKVNWHMLIWMSGHLMR